MLLELYITILVGLNAWEYARAPTDYVRVLVKNQSLLPTTLFHMLVTNVVGTYSSDRFLRPTLHEVDDLLTELLRFFVTLHLVEAWTFFTHYGMHRFWYRPHKKHHQVTETSVLFTYHNGLLDAIVAAVPFYTIPLLMGVSRWGYVATVGYHVLMGSLAHRMPTTRGDTAFSFHNYHHAAFMYNFGTGYPGTFHVWDRLFGTLRSF